MRVLNIYDGPERVYPGLGSVPSVVYYLAKSLAKKGVEVTIVERRWQGTEYREEFDGIIFERFDLKISSNKSNEETVAREIRKFTGLTKFILDRFVFALKVSKYIDYDNFDVIHVHLPFSSNILINLNRKLRKKMIYTAHVGEERKRFGLSKDSPFLLKVFSPDLYLVKRVAKTVVLNEPLRKKLVEKGIPEKKLEVIPNGVCVEEFNIPREKIEIVKRKYDIEGTVVMFAGTVTPRKGVEHLIKAGEILKDEEVLFLVVGPLDIDKEYAKKVIEYVKNKEINAKFTGVVPYEDLKALYSACDIFVLPSFEEGDPIALKEALASGKPLIGSNVGGIPMQIRDGWNGFLVEPANEKQLAEKIRYLVENEEERVKMGERSRELAKKEFDWKKIAERYIEVYKSIL
ncbi:MAG: glycosyltransferase family 4 protein [Elusimicrobiota bacterium]|nr:glycosyltransferase family 4 protein [Endomicrobiia bacterium]MDW8166257.1 glycosyltransferase family 4 protein [Elusimicrobiota bacterium]